MGLFLKYKYFKTLQPFMAVWRRFLVSFMVILVFVFELSSQIIYVGGEMSSSQTWNNENIYIVNQDLIVPTGVVLTINAGVIVRVDYNRGIIIDNGSVRVLGERGDSVSFIPNHSVPQEVWNWKGMEIKNTSGDNYFRFAKFNGAETAIKLQDCNNVIVENSCIIDCQNYGFQFTNSSYCLLDSCEVINNHNGIEMLTGLLGAVSGNTISNCKITNQNQNIYILGESGGSIKNNNINGNFIGFGNNGIWIINRGQHLTSGNTIQRNVFVDNGSEVGYGLFLASDSTVVKNNIFWRNNVALYSEDDANNCSILSNSFYQNTEAIVLGTGSQGNEILHNTFSLNKDYIIRIRETFGIEFHQNNMFHNGDKENIVFNNTQEDLNVNYNFWGTVVTEEIDRLIYDRMDNLSLGELIYNPFLSLANTINPISPPYNLIKQIDGDKLILTWNPNSEVDLMGYKIYFGDYDNYSFSGINQIGLDTSFVLDEDISVYDSVAITAYDSSMEGNNSQFTGSESPYTFGVFYPFSGNDTTICNDLNRYEIDNSNIPFDYEDLLWSTSGDGFFSNPGVLNPTYFPGFQDHLNGGATISLEVNTLSKWYIDSFKLSIIKTPIAFAGNDTIVFPDIPLLLSNATAYNYDSIKWISSGDGVFEYDNLVNPIYYPGINDIEVGEVTLELTAYSYCEHDIDTVKVVIESYYSVEGTILNNGRYTDKYVVLAFMQDEVGARAVQIEESNDDGTFKFNKLITGDYYFYAVPDTNNIDNLVPTYYANKINWESAYLLTVDSDVYDVDIQFPTVDYILPYGEASISGNMAMPPESNVNSEVYCRYWMTFTNNPFCTNGMSNATILLYNHDMTKLLDYTLTDNHGDFYFNNLPYGTYVIDAEKAAYLSVASPPINLSPEHKLESGVILEISQQKLAFTLSANVQLENPLSVFPNPANNELNISYLNPLFLSANLVIYDLFGNQLLISEIPSESINSSNFKIDISELPSGLYFGQITSSSNSLQFRFIKR